MFNFKKFKDMSEKNNNSAFPPHPGPHPEDIPKKHRGMSKRFYAACEAMEGMLSSLNGIPSHPNEISHIAKVSYLIADEMLKQEEENNNDNTQ